MKWLKKFYISGGRDHKQRLYEVRTCNNEELLCSLVNYMEDCGFKATDGVSEEWLADDFVDYWVSFEIDSAQEKEMFEYWYKRFKEDYKKGLCGV